MHNLSYLFQPTTFISLFVHKFKMFIPFIFVLFAFTHSLQLCCCVGQGVG